MRKYFLTGIVLSLLSIGTSFACDICGCGVGNFNPYMFPHLSKNFISLGYNYRYNHTHLTDNGVEMANAEYYRTLMLTGQYSPVKGLQLMASLPTQFNKQTGPEGLKTLNRIGDAILLANYRLLSFNTGKGKNKFSHTFTTGAGVKLATGEYGYDESNEKDVANPNFQAGTGSTDFLLNGAYNARTGNWAATAGASYKINTSNKADYKFGNRMLGVLQVKNIQTAGKYTIIPNLGMNYEHMADDKSAGAEVEHTGGHLISLTGGIDINNKQWAVGFVYLKPVSQNLGEGHIHSMPGFNLHLSYSF